MTPCRERPYPRPALGILRRQGEIDYDHERTGAWRAPILRLNQRLLRERLIFNFDRKPLVHESHDKDHNEILLSAL